MPDPASPRFAQGDSSLPATRPRSGLHTKSPSIPPPTSIDHTLPVLVALFVVDLVPTAATLFEQLQFPSLGYLLLLQLLSCTIIVVILPRVFVSERLSFFFLSTLPSPPPLPTFDSCQVDPAIDLTTTRPTLLCRLHVCRDSPFNRCPDFTQGGNCLLGSCRSSC